MKKIFDGLVFTMFLALIVVSCQNNTEKKKVEAIGTEQLAKEITANLPTQTEEIVHPGKTVYSKYCLTCHQSDGLGVPGMHPPLGPGSWVEKDPKELVALLMKGLSGKVEVNNEVYNNFMPSQATLSIQEMADVLSYIRSSFGNHLDPVDVEMVKTARSGR